MIIGMGIDITDQQRISESIKKFGEKFLSRILTIQEIEACNRYRFPLEHYAGKFAAKEALMKAIGRGLGTISFQEIEVLNHDNGAPYIKTYGKVTTLINHLEITTIHVSISHDADKVVAVVILEK